MVNVSFNFVDASGGLIEGTLHLTPVVAPNAQTPFIISGQSTEVTCFGNHKQPIVPLIAAKYKARLMGTALETEFYFDITNVTDGSNVNVNDFIV